MALIENEWERGFIRLCYGEAIFVSLAALICYLVTR